MKIAPALFMLAMAAVLSSHAAALHANALYKCATNDIVVYQDRPCPNGTQTVVQVVVPTFGESPRKLFRYTRSTVEVPGKDVSLVGVSVPVVAAPPRKD